MTASHDVALIEEEHAQRAQLAEYKGRERRIVWVLTNDLDLVLENGYAVNSVYPQNPGPDKALFFPALGSTIGSKRYRDSLRDGGLMQKEAIIKRIADHRVQIARLEAKL